MTNIQWLLGRLLSSGLVTLLSVACGGEPFAAEAEFNPLPTAGATNEAGAGDVTPTAGYAGSGASGGSSQAGSSSGGTSSQGGAGAPSGGSGAAAGSAATAGAPSCELDAARITATLPKSFVWKDFSIASGNVCASCTYEPCSQLATEWGNPTVLGDHVTYAPVYTPTASVPLLVHVTKNSGACSGGVQCELKPETISVSLSMVRKGDVWRVDSVAVFVAFAANDCMNGIGKPEELTGPVAKDLQEEIQASVVGLEIPCN